jgi:hypothetical protein
MDKVSVLYADATEDQRRAMIKSYQESNGTSLSTNWEEVSKNSFANSSSSSADCLTMASQLCCLRDDEG